MEKLAAINIKVNTVYILGYWGHGSCDAHDIIRT